MCVPDRSCRRELPMLPALQIMLYEHERRFPFIHSYCKTNWKLRSMWPKVEAKMYREGCLSLY